MPNGQREQRNPYKGDPPRSWVKVEFEKADGTGNITKQLVADTGWPLEATISKENMRKLKLANGEDVPKTNFGKQEGGWVCIKVPELGLEK